MKKRLLSLLVASVVCATAVVPVGALSSYPGAKSAFSVPVYINGERQYYEKSASQVDGAVFVPMRGIFEDLGAKVQWDQKTKKVTATKGSTKIELQVKVKTAKVNGKSVTLTSPPVQSDGYVMVPLRFVSEALGASVNWDGKERRVDITTSDVVSSASTKPVETVIELPDETSSEDDKYAHPDDAHLIGDTITIKNPETGAIEYHVVMEEYDKFVVAVVFEDQVKRMGSPVYFKTDGSDKIQEMKLDDDSYVELKRTGDLKKVVSISLDKKTWLKLDMPTLAHDGVGFIVLQKKTGELVPYNPFEELSGTTNITMDSSGTTVTRNGDEGSKTFEEVTGGRTVVDDLGLTYKETKISGTVTDAVEKAKFIIFRVIDSKGNPIDSKEFSYGKLIYAGEDTWGMVFDMGNGYYNVSKSSTSAKLSIETDSKTYELKTPEYFVWYKNSVTPVYEIVVK